MEKKYISEQLFFKLLSAGLWGDQRPVQEFKGSRSLSMAVVRDFEELAIFQKARELSKKIIKEIRTSEYAGAKYKEFNGSIVQED